MRKLIFLFLIAVLLSSCLKIYHYFPSYSVVPDFQKKNELQINGSFGDISKIVSIYDNADALENPYCYDIQMGYSVTNNFFVSIQSSYNVHKISHKNFFNEGLYYSNFINQVSYFTNGINLGLSNRYNKLLIGIKSGFSMGNLTLKYYENSSPDSKNIFYNADYRSLSLTPFLAYEIDYCQIAFQLNLKNASYSNINDNLNSISSNSDFKYFKQFQTLNRSYSELFAEPSITVKGGLKNAKLVLQAIRSFNSGSTQLEYMSFNLYIGCEFKLDIDKIFNFLDK